MVLSEEEKDFMHLRLAAFNNDVVTIEKLIHKNPNLVFSVDERRQTALIAACSNGRREAARLLLFHGSDWYHKSLDG
jgi:ankyrin repeat protein